MGYLVSVLGGTPTWCYDTPLFPLFRTYTLLQAPTIGIEAIARLIRLTEHLLDRGLKLPRLVVVVDPASQLLLGRLGKMQVGGNGLDIMYKIFAGCINGGVTNY